MELIKRQRLYLKYLLFAYEFLINYNQYMSCKYTTLINGIEIIIIIIMHLIPIKAIFYFETRERSFIFKAMIIFKSQERKIF